MVTFLFRISSISDVITNSSSELFVFDSTKHKGLDSLIEILNSAYPQWRLEYKEPEIVGDYNDEDINWFYDWYKVYEDVESEWVDTYYITPEKFDELKKLGVLNEAQFAKKMGCKPEEFFSNWKIWNPGLKIGIDDMSWEEQSKYRYLELSDLGRNKFREYCKNQGFIALVSKDENPDFDKQDILRDLATAKYHLG